MAQTVEELAKKIDEFRADSDKNTETISKILANISSNLNNDDETSDLLKVYFPELKKVLEERHARVVSEFSNLEKSFDAIKEQQTSFAKSTELQTAYNILSNNIQTNLNELYNQHSLFEDIKTQINTVINDKTDKNDIINAVGVLRNELEIADTNFTNSVSEIRSNTQSILKNLTVMDPTAQNDLVKRELENIYIATNSIISILNDVEQHNTHVFNTLKNTVSKDELSAATNSLSLNISDGNAKIDRLLEILGQKIDDIALATNDSKVLYEFDNIKKLLNEQKSVIENTEQPEKINNIIGLLDAISQKIDVLQNTDLQDTSEKISQVINQSYREISDKLNNLPSQTDFADLYHSMNDFSTIIDTLKTVLSNSSEEMNSTISSKLSEFKTILDGTISENDFADFRHNLADYIQTIVDNSNALNENFNNQRETLESIITKIDDSASKLNIEAIDTMFKEMQINSSANRDKILEEIKNAGDEIKSQFETLQVPETLNNLSNNIEMLKSTLESAHEDQENGLNEKISGLRDIISGGLNSRDEKFLLLEEKLNEFIESYNKLTNETGVQIGNSLSDISDMKSKIEDVASIFTEWSAGSSDRDSKLVSMITTSLDEIKEAFSDLQNSVRGDIASQMYQSSGLIRQELDNLAAKIEELKAQLNSVDNDESYEKLNNRIDTFGNEIQNNINLLKDSISSAYDSSTITEKFLALRDILSESADKNNAEFERFNEKINEFIAAGEKISDATEIKIGNSISEISDLKEEIKNIAKNFAEWNFNQGEHDSKLVSMISGELDSLKDSISDLQDFVQTGVHQELSRASELIDDRVDKLSYDFERLSNDLQSKSGSNSYDNSEIQDIKDKINAVKQEINLVNTDIIDTVNAKTEALLTELMPIKALLEGYTPAEVSADRPQNEELLDAISDLKEYISEVCGGYNKDNTAEELKNIIGAALNDDSTKWAIEDLEENFAKRIDDNTSKINELLDVLNQKVDVWDMSNNDDINYNLEDIRNMIASQKELLETSTDVQKISEIQNRLSELLNKIETIETVGTSEISDIKESILEAIINVFEQISFIEESEDIKDFVEEKTDEINQNIIEVKEQLKQFVDGAEDEYSYTLQDVESDIAKLRLVINDLSNSSTNEEISDISNNIHRIVSSVEDMQNSLTQDQISGLKSDFEKLSEDVLSISSRTNKLILSSDESYNALNNGLNDFSNVISKLEERINYLDNKEITERIEEKLNNTYNVVTNSANSDKVMRQALMYMGEWIDTASENLQSLCENAETQNSDSDEIKEALEEIKNSLPEQRELLNSVTLHFEEQQDRMDRLEMKLEKILSAIDNIDDTKLVNKIDKVDKQVKKLSTTIEKLATYVDE